MRDVLRAVFLSTLCAACGGSPGESGARYSLSLDRDAVLLEADHRSPLPEPVRVNVTFVGDGVIVGLAPGSEGASWLNVSMPDVITGRVVPVSLGVVDTHLAPGSHSATLRFYTGRADGSEYVFQDLAVRYDLHDRATFPDPGRVFSAVAGGPAPSPQPMQFTFGGAATAWNLESDQPWLSADHLQGTGSGSFQIQVDSTGLTAGTHTGHLTLRAVGGRVPATATVELRVRPRRIWSSLDGVALAAVPGHTALQRDVVLYDNAGSDGVTWTAASDRPWLSTEILPSGRLRLTADPADLPAGLSTATVVVTSDGAQVENAAPIRVGLWKSAGAPAEGHLVDLLPRDVGPYPRVSIAVDPIRPRLYLLDDPGSTILGFNTYTGALEVTFPTLAGEELSGIVASSDGRFLFAGNDTRRVVHRLDLDEAAWADELAYLSNYSIYSPGAYVRPEGHPVLLLGDVPLDVEREAQLELVGYLSVEAILEDQQHVIGIEGRARMEYDGVDHLLRLDLERAIPWAQAAWFVGASRDGSRVFAGGTLSYGYGFTTYRLDPEGDYTFGSYLSSVSYPSVAEVGDNGVLYAGLDAYYDEETVTAYGPDDTPLGTYSIGTYRNLLRGRLGMKLSADGQRLLLVSRESAYGSRTSLWGFKTKP